MLLGNLILFSISFRGVSCTALQLDDGQVSVYQLCTVFRIRIQLVARIRIRNADPNPGGLKRAKIKKKRSKKQDN
jgi:hypothetical protein